MPAPRALDGVHAVVTPEHVEFTFVLAGLYSRFLAWLVDFAIVLFGAGALMAMLQRVLSSLPGFLSAAGFLVYFLLDWGYGIALETAWSGQTVGKRILGLRVLQESGVRIGFYAAALRNLARAFDRLPVLYLVGGAAALLSGSQQRLGDMLAGTVVVRDRRLRIPSSLTRAAPDLPPDPSLAAKVKRLGRPERELLLSAALRREELGLTARLALFGALARRLEDALDVVKPPHLSDEKLVLWITAAVAAEPGAAGPRALPQ